MNNQSEEATKLKKRLDLLRQEYIKLQERLNEAERENAILSANSNGVDSPVKSKGFISKVLQTIKSLHNQEKYSDVIVQLQEVKVPGHKFILAIRNEEWGADSVEIIDWSGIPQDVGAAVLKWIYTNETDFLAEADDEFCLTLMRKAKEFRLTDLMNKCEESLLGSVHVHNCILYYTTAEEIQAQLLQRHCSDMISAHWDDFTPKDFSHMTAPLLYNMFKSKTNYPLHSAIRLQREDVVFLYLIEFSSSLQTRLNESDDKGCLPLDLALKSGREDIAQTLVDHKVNINQMDVNKSSLLHNAIQRKDEFSAMFLLEKGADPNVRDARGDTPLHLAARSEEMAKVAGKLVDVGAEVNAQSNHSKTPLNVCIENNNKVCFDILMGSDDLNVNLKSTDQESMAELPPIFFILKNFGKEEVAKDMAEKIIDKGADLKSTYEGANSLLHLCAFESNEEACLFLLSKDQRIDLPNGHGDTPLHAAAKGGLPMVVSELLSLKADPNIQSHEINDGIARQTPVHLAVTKKDLVMVKLFLESSIDLNLKDSAGKTVLGVALSLKEFPIATELLKGGSDVNDGDINGMTLLHISVTDRDEETARFLLEAGADLNLASHSGKTPLQTAIEIGEKSIVEDLCRFGADMSLSSSEDPPLWIALEREEDDLASILVRHGVDTDSWVDGPESCRQTLLHRAIDENKTHAACFLIRAGCNVNQVRKPGPGGEGGEEAHDLAAPLHLCCQWGLEEVVETLLEHNADINARDVEGKTPLHMAIENGFERVINKLLDQRAIDLCVRDKMGLSSFACAMTFKNQKAARRILELEPSAADQLDSKGRNFLHTAILKDDLESVLFLLSINANVHSKTQDQNKLSPLLLAVTKGNEMIVRNLILAGSSLEDLTTSGQTALQVAAELGLSGIASILISNGINFGAVDGRGNNALHLAVKEGHLDVVRVLLTESSIDAELVNNKGRNPLHVLANFGKESSVPIFLLFMECMPNYPLNKLDEEGNTPLLLAYMKGNGALCRSLISHGAVLGTVNSNGVSIFNCQVASKQLLQRLLDFLSTEPKWGEGDFCEECNNKFGITNRKHHCRHCGRILCGKCSDKEIPILKYGLSKPSRVCGVCADVLTIGVA